MSAPAPTSSSSSSSTLSPAPAPAPTSSSSSSSTLSPAPAPAPTSSSSSPSALGLASVGSSIAPAPAPAPDSLWSPSSFSSIHSARHSASAAPEYVPSPHGGYILKSIALMPTITLSVSEMIRTYGARIPLGVTLGRLDIKYNRTLTSDEISFVVAEAVDLVRGAGVNKTKLNDLGVRFTAYCTSATYAFP